MVDYLNMSRRRPGLDTARTATPYIVTMGCEFFSPGSFAYDSSNSRDPGNTGYPQFLRPGLMLGMITSTKKWAPSVIGTVAAAYDGSTTVNVSAAVATEIVRRIGATGTFKLTGPATAAGTVRTLTATYSAVNTSTGDITVTALTVNEVQTVSVNTIMSGGKIGFTAIDKDGVPQTVAVAYNTSWTQTVADIQTALNGALGASAVACAVTATKNMTITFSGTNYAGLPQTEVTVDISAATGPTTATVTTTTAGVDGRMIAGAYVQPTDGSETIKTIIPNGYEVWVVNVDGVNTDVDFQNLLIGGLIKSDTLINWPSDASLKAYVKAALKAFGPNFAFTDDAGW